MFYFEEFKYSSSCILRCNSPTLSFEMVLYHSWQFPFKFYDSQVVKNEILWIHHFLFDHELFQPILISSLELSCVIFHLKPSLRNVAIVVIINGPSYLSIISVEEVIHLVGVIISIICFCTGRISPQLWEVFHKPTTSLFFSLLVFQQLRSILLRKDAL